MWCSVVAREARLGKREEGWMGQTCQRGEGIVRKRQGKQERRDMVQAEQISTEEMALVMWWW